MTTWISKAGAYTVDRVPCPNPGAPVDASKPPAGVVHTTEGPPNTAGWDSALNEFRQHYAPHFLVGAGRIAQLVPLGTMGGALLNPAGGVETNGWARAQIEVVGYSSTSPWLPGADTLRPLAALLAALVDAAGIPLSRPYPDAMPPLPWATTAFPRRHDGSWGAKAGWYGHVEVPENDHWDPGALDWSSLLAAADAVNAPPAALKRYWVLLGGEPSAKGRLVLASAAHGDQRGVDLEKATSFVTIANRHQEATLRLTDPRRVAPTSGTYLRV